MWKLLSKLNKNLTLAIPITMLAGFLFGITMQTAFLKSLIIPFTFLMVYPMMVTLKIKKVFEGGDLKAQILTQIINFCIVPFIAFGLGMIFFRNQPYMALGLILAGLVPTSGMTISWTGFAKGNVEAAVKMTVIGLTLGSVATPFYIRFLMGADIDVNILLVIKQIVVIVFLPMLAGYATQQGLVRKFGVGDFQKRIAPKFPALSTAGVIGIVFIAIALKAKSIADSPQMLLFILAPLSLIYAFNFTLSTIAGRLFLKRGDAIALVYGSVMRNLSIALAIAINAFGTEGSSAALVVAIAYIIQVQSAAWYVKFTDRIFGAAKTTESASEEKAPVKPHPKTAAFGGTEVSIPVIRKVLYATDLSETAIYAAGYACDFAARDQTDVTVLHVVPDAAEELSSGTGISLSGHSDRLKIKEINEQKRREAEKALRQKIHETASCSLQQSDVRIETGNPVKIISDIAEKERFDLIIMGSHGYGKLEDVMIGSISAGVMRDSSIPVMIVRLPGLNNS